MQQADSALRLHRILQLGLLAGGLVASHCFASPAAKDPVDRLKEGMPAPVAALIDRMVQCQHWAGEEPYDEARRREIAQAVRQLRCDSLEQDERRLLKVHASRTDVRQRIEAARDAAW